MAISVPLYSLIFHNTIQTTPDTLITTIEDAVNNVMKSGKLIDPFTMRLIFEYKQTNDIMLLIHNTLEKYINDTISFVINNTKNKQMSITVFIELFKRTLLKTNILIYSLGEPNYSVYSIFDNLINDKLNSSFFDMFDFVNCSDEEFSDIIDILQHPIYHTFSKRLFQNCTFVNITVTKYIGFILTKQFDSIQKMIPLLEKSLLFFELYKNRILVSTEESINIVFTELNLIKQMKSQYYKIQSEIKRILVLKIRLLSQIQLLSIKNTQ